MAKFLEETRKKVKLAVVGGSDLPKIVEQLGNDQDHGFDFYFCS